MVGRSGIVDTVGMVKLCEAAFDGNKFREHMADITKNVFVMWPIHLAGQYEKASKWPIGPPSLKVNLLHINW